MTVAYLEIPPAPALAPFVRCYWQLRGAAPKGGVTSRILPDGCADVLFELGEPARFPDGPHAPARWIGTMTRAVVAESHGRIDTFGVRFNPGGLWSLTGMPLHILTDGYADLDDLDPLGLKALPDSLQARSLAERAQALDAALGRALTHVLPLPSVARALARIPLAGTVPTVASLAGASGCTPRTLERRCRDIIGVTPKQHLRFLRFERALRQLRSGSRGAAVAAQVGYTDQAHLVHEFRRFAGLPPGEFARECEWSRRVPTRRPAAPAVSGVDENAGSGRGPRGLCPHGDRENADPDR